MGDASPAQIRCLAMDYLARREHGYHELIQKLLERGVDERAAEDAVRQLANEGLQNDQRFAEAYARAQANRGRGPRYIVNGLRQRGLDSTDANRAVGSLGRDWALLALEVASRKYPDSAPSTAEYASRQRFLSQRGFTAEQISSALRSLRKAKSLSKTG